jgi:hypothetical protein
MERMRAAEGFRSVRENKERYELIIAGVERQIQSLSQLWTVPH